MTEHPKVTYKPPTVQDLGTLTDLTLGNNPSAKTEGQALKS